MAACGGQDSETKATNDNVSKLTKVQGVYHNCSTVDGNRGELKKLIINAKEQKLIVTSIQSDKKDCTSGPSAALPYVMPLSSGKATVTKSDATSLEIESDTDVQQIRDQYADYKIKYMFRKAGKDLYLVKTVETGKDKFNQNRPFQRTSQQDLQYKIIKPASSSKPYSSSELERLKASLNGTYVWCQAPSYLPGPGGAAVANNSKERRIIRLHIDSTLNSFRLWEYSAWSCSDELPLSMGGISMGALPPGAFEGQLDLLKVRSTEFQVDVKFPKNQGGANLPGLFSNSRAPTWNMTNSRPTGVRFQFMKVGQDLLWSKQIEIRRLADEAKVEFDVESASDVNKLLTRQPVGNFR